MCLGVVWEGFGRFGGGVWEVLGRFLGGVWGALGEAFGWALKVFWMGKIVLHNNLSKNKDNTVGEL